MTKRYNPGPSKEDPIFENYIGSYVSIESSQGTSVGKIIGIKDGYAFLCPFLNTNFSSGAARKEMSEDTEVVNLCALISMRPITKKSLEEFCKLENSK